MTRVMWVLATVVILVAIAFFSRWRRSAADARAVAAERGRIHRLVAQPPADNGSERSKNEP